MNKIKSFFKKTWELIKNVPWYGWVAAIGIIGLQYGMYRLATVIADATGSMSWAYCPKIPFDDQIPLIPGFVLVYVYSYPFWTIAPIVISFTSKKNFIDFTIGAVSAILIGFIILVAAPTYMDRVAEGLIDIRSKGGFFNQFLQLIYNSDYGNLNLNLLPSFHCLLSLYCYFGIHRQKEIPLGLKIFSIISVFFICLSTIFTKQHYFMDIFAGLGVSVVVYILVRIIKPGERILAHQKEKAKQA